MVTIFFDMTGDSRASELIARALDKAAFAPKYLSKIRAAKENGSLEDLKRYFDLMMDVDCSNIEAQFTYYYALAKDSLEDFDSALTARQHYFSNLQSMIHLLELRYTAEKREETKALMEMMTEGIYKLLCSDFWYSTTTHGITGRVLEDNKNATLGCLRSLLTEYMICSHNERQ